MKIELPGEMDSKLDLELRSAELDRAIELIKAGKLWKVCRIAGEYSNFTIWEADSPEEYHSDISSLNLHPWMRLEITSII